MTRRILFLLFAVLCAMPSMAQTIPWTAAGTTAVIDESSVPLYALTPPYIGFNGSGVGVITAYFNVTDTSGTGLPGWSTLRISYFDNAAPSQVSAALWQVDKCDGTQVQLCFVAGFDSATNTCHSCSFTQIIDFNRYEYYIQAQLYRATTALQPKLFALRLF
ncbi:MAG: hypothetical protein ABUT39_00005 [Acidobacteriota bacterium]